MKHHYFYQNRKANHDYDKQYFKQIKKSLWKCMECHVNTLGTSHYYMVRNELWKEITSKKFKGHLHEKGMLCLNCVEKRLGRKLTLDDFDLNIPVNYNIEKIINNRDENGKIIIEYNFPIF